MTEIELKLALQREGEAQIRGFWHEAEVTVSTKRQQIEAERIQLRRETDRKLQSESALLSSTLLFAAQARAQKSRLKAEAAIENRLLILAQKLLPELAGKNRSGLWRALRAELPQADWRIITVHPADRPLTMHDFPEADICVDETLAGGLVASTADGVFRVDNSLGCRLQRAWPDLLPQLLAEVRKLVGDNETTETQTSV
jgi:vacuolar-type H+-ATPase subunit E/Vma4